MKKSIGTLVNLLGAQVFRQYLAGGFVALVLALVSAGPSFALPMGTVDFYVELTGLGPSDVWCMQATFADASFDVFGTPVNLGTQVGGLVCNGGTDLPVHCTSYPTPGIFDFDGKITALFDTPTTAFFIVDQITATGSLPQALGSTISFTFDGRAQASGAPPGAFSGCTLSAPLIASGHGGINAFEAAATTVGADVPVNTSTTYFNPVTGVDTPVSVDLNFSNVETGGVTTVTASSNASAVLTNNFSISAGGYQATFLDIKTTATFSGPVTICTSYADADNDGTIDDTTLPETALSFLHEEGDPLTFVDRTSSRDTTNNVICAEVSSFSHFVTAVRTSGICAAEGNACDDGNACTTADACDASLVCVGGPPPSCDDGSVCTFDTCIAPSGCAHLPATPANACLAPLKSVLQLSQPAGKPQKDSLVYKWLKGPAMVQSQFGDPTTSDGYSLCIFDARGVAAIAEIAPAGQCGKKLKPCWSAVKTTGYKFADPDGLQDGVKTVKLLGNAKPKSSVLVKAKGTNLTAAPLALVPPVTARLVRADEAICFESTFETLSVKKNLVTLFKAVTP